MRIGPHRGRGWGVALSVALSGCDRSTPPRPPQTVAQAAATTPTSVPSAAPRESELPSRTLASFAGFYGAIEGGALIVGVDPVERRVVVERWRRPPSVFAIDWVSIRDGSTERTWEAEGAGASHWTGALRRHDFQPLTGDFEADLAACGELLAPLYLNGGAPRLGTVRSAGGTTLYVSANTDLAADAVLHLRGSADTFPAPGEVELSRTGTLFATYEGRERVESDSPIEVCVYEAKTFQKRWCGAEPKDVRSVELVAFSADDAALYVVAKRAIEGSVSSESCVDALTTSSGARTRGPCGHIAFAQSTSGATGIVATDERATLVSLPDFAVRGSVSYKLERWPKPYDAIVDDRGRFGVVEPGNGYEPAHLVVGNLRTNQLRVISSKEKLGPPDGAFVGPTFFLMKTTREGLDLVAVNVDAELETTRDPLDRFP